MSDKYSALKHRLEAYIESKNFNNKADFARWIGIDPNILYFVLTGRRPASRNFVDKLVMATGKPEEYWFYGVTDNTTFLDTREECKNTRRVVDDLLDLGLIDEDGVYTSDKNQDQAKQLIYLAAYSDIIHMLEKRKKDKK